MTNTIEDITQKSDLILLVGSNPEHAHPVLGMQIRRAVHKGTKLIVVDPRDIDLATCRRCTSETDTGYKT